MILITFKPINQQFQLKVNFRNTTQRHHP